MTIDMDEQYETRDGRAVRILCVDAPGEYPVLGLVEGKGTMVWRWQADGTKPTMTHNRYDLVEVPKSIPFYELEDGERFLFVKCWHRASWSDARPKIMLRPAVGHNNHSNSRWIVFDENTDGRLYTFGQGDMVIAIDRGGD